MPAQEQTPRIYGFLKHFPKGIDSYKNPLELPTDQLSYAVNATMRGDFAALRPNFFKMTLVDNTGGAFQAGLFQGASYFLTSDGNIMCAVNGQLFQLSASGQSTLVVNQVTLPDTGNLATAVQNWLWQSERWLIWNDGVHLPVFYDGTTARRSLGPAVIGQPLTQIGSILSALVVPPIGQSSTIQISPTVSPAYVGISFLLGNMQFTLQSVSSSATQNSVNLNTNVIQSTLGDYLLCQNSGSTFVGATLTTNNQYMSTIAGITQNGQSITDWGDIQAPAANGSITITTGSGMTVDASIASETNTEVQCYGNPALKQAYAMNLGDPISLNGNACTVIGLLHGQDVTSGNVTAITIQPTSNYTGPINNDNSVNVEVSYSLGLRFFLKGSFLAKAIVSTKTGVPVAPPPGSSLKTDLPAWDVTSTSSNLFTWDSLNNQNYFTVALNQTPKGLNATTLYTFTAYPSSGSASVTGVTFTGYWGGASNPLSLVNCTMASPPPVGNAVALISGAATNVSQYIQVTKAGSVAFVPVITNVATVYNVTNANASPPTYGNLSVPNPGTALTIPLQPVGNINSGTLLFASAVNSSGAPNGNTDVFVATGASVVAGSSGTWASFINQTGTAEATIPSGTPITPLPEIPISTIGVYGLGRNWVALPDGVSFLGGDIVGGSSGDLQFNYTDAVLKVSQNLFLSNGTTFKIPGPGEKLVAMQFVACLDASLGQGPLQVFTTDTVFSCNAPPDATTWASLTSPILTESLIGSGGISNNAVTQSNADLIFRTPDGGVQSMLLARLDYNSWGNTPISTEITQAIQNDNVSLLPYCSSVLFTNRFLMTCQPFLSARGVYHEAIVALNFDAISSLQGKAPSIWEGVWTGLNVLQLVTGVFASVKRCFALCLDPTLTQIEVHEILPDNAPVTVDNLSDDVTWSITSPMIFNKDEQHMYKRLIDGEIYLTDITIAGVVIAAFYKVDQNNAWEPWYTTTVSYLPSDTGYRPRVGLGQPSPKSFDSANNRPTREGYDFQVMLQFTGSCTFLGGRFAADIIPQPEFAKPT